MQNLIYVLLLGALAGWVAGKLTAGKGFGVLMNIVVGVVGSVIGKMCFRLLGFPTDRLGALAEVIVAVIGALLLLALVNAIAKRR